MAFQPFIVSDGTDTITTEDRKNPLSAFLFAHTLREFTSHGGKLSDFLHNNQDVVAASSRKLPAHLHA